MAEESSTRKKVIVVIAILVALIAPLALLSNWGLAWVEGKALADAPEDWGASLQLKCATAYGLTLRPEERRAALETFLKHWPQHPRRGYAKFQIAVIMEKDHEVSKRQAAEAYEEFLYQYANDPVFKIQPDAKAMIQEAQRAVKRLPLN